MLSMHKIEFLLLDCRKPVALALTSEPLWALTSEKERQVCRPWWYREFNHGEKYGGGSFSRRILTGFGDSSGTFLGSCWEVSVGGSLWGLKGQDTLSIYFVKTN